MLPARPTSIDDGFTRRAARARLAPHPRPRRFGSKAAADAIHEVVEIEVLESSLAKDPDDPDDRRNYETVLNYYKAALAQIQRQIPGVVCCGAFETGGCARMGGSVSVAGCRRRGRGFRTGHMARSAIAICRTVTYGRVRLGIDAGAVRTRLGCIQTLARTVVAALNESVDVCARSSGFIGPFLKKACTLWPVAVAFPSGALAGFPAPR